MKARPEMIECPEAYQSFKTAAKNPKKRGPKAKTRDTA